MKDNYTPFGSEWEAEMKKLPKTMLIEMFAKSQQKNIEYREALEYADELLSRLEDHTHGKDGVDITTTRRNIQQALNSKD